MKTIFFVALLALGQISYGQQVYHVSVKGKDSNPGTRTRPLRTISAAALLAMPGDTVLVHGGTYRERVDPPRGGVSADRRITYLAARGEKVIITGAERVKGWKRVHGNIWSLSLPNSFFGKFNPYSDWIHGDWFRGIAHTGAVYLANNWLVETINKADLMQDAGKAQIWLAEVGSERTTIWARFLGVDPNLKNVEINVRQTVFYPSHTGINYLTVKGFMLCKAATPWAPPTAEQIGLIGTNWSRGWIIEDNTVSYSKCSGISLGKYGDEFDNKAESADGYVRTINRALRHGWCKDSVGSHLVRNNTISHCEQAGIVGSLGCAFSRIIGNDIHDIHVLHLFDGAEMAGIKFHGAIDVEIAGNRIRHNYRGIWLDWMAQGTRVSRNILYDNSDLDLFCEVDHGPYLVDDNIFLSRLAFRDISGGGAICHNLFGGIIRMRQDTGRHTPYLKPHSTAIAGFQNLAGGDMRYYNNIFLVSPSAGQISLDRTQWNGDPEYGLGTYNGAALPVMTSGNIFMYDSMDIHIDKDDKQVSIQYIAGLPAQDTACPLVNTALLGLALIPNCRFENPDGSPITIDTDFLGRKRKGSCPTPGPIEVGPDQQTIRLWGPKNALLAPAPISGL